MDFLCGGLAAGGASIFSNPFDVLKTRMQLQGELSAKGQHAVHYRNIFHAGFVIAKNEGLRGLQKGLVFAMLSHGTRNFFRLGIYQTAEGSGYLRDQSGKTIFLRSILASSVAGSTGAFIGSPLLMMKTQLQAQAAKNIAVGYQHGHSSGFKALSEIYHQNGIFGLWRGVTATMLRAVVGSSAQLTSFVMAKDQIRQYEFFKNSPVLTSFAASIIAGFIQTIVMNPFDVVSTRLYNQGVDVSGKGLLYSGLLDCFAKVFKSEGAYGFYKGVVANYARLAPHSIFTLIFWDALKNLKVVYFEKQS